MAPSQKQTRQRRSRRGKRVSAPVMDCAPSRGFGAMPPPSLGSMYSSSGSATGSVTTHTELGLQITDFFDYSVTDATAGGIPQIVTNYFWDCNQNLFQNGTGSSPISDNEFTFCRVRRLEVYVLPAKGFEIGAGTGPNTNNAQGMFTVQCQVPGITQRDLSGSSDAIATDTQVTNVLPQIDTFWKKVLHCDLQKTFQSGVVRPYFDDTGTNVNLQCLFQMAIVNSTDGSTYLLADDTNLTIRVKVVLHVDQPISTIQNAKLKVFKNESFLSPSKAQNGTPFSDATLQYVQTDLDRVRNNFR